MSKSRQFIHRIQQLQQLIGPKQAWLLSNSFDITYFSGFRTLVQEEREAFLLITHTQAHLFHVAFSPFTAPKLPEQKSLKQFSVLVGQPLTQLTTTLQNLVTANALTSLLLDTDHLSVTEYQSLQQIQPLQLLSLDRQAIWQQRFVKDAAELKSMTLAGKIAARAMSKVIKTLRVGMTEFEVRNLIEMSLFEFGSEQIAFPTIVAFGNHSALPHHQPGTAKLKPEMSVLLDFGATVKAYRSDMTRTIWFGQRPPELFNHIEKVVHQAYQAAKSQLRLRKSDVTARDIDSAARELITAAGYGAEFIHTTGHGIGLDIHENLSLSYRNETILTPGMVITIEPGIYLPGKFGYRYENTVAITPKGAVELTK